MCTGGLVARPKVIGPAAVPMIVLLIVHEEYPSSTPGVTQAVHSRPGKGTHNYRAQGCVYGCAYGCVYGSAYSCARTPTEYQKNTPGVPQEYPSCAQAAQWSVGPKFLGPKAVPIALPIAVAIPVTIAVPQE